METVQRGPLSSRSVSGGYSIFGLVGRLIFFNYSFGLQGDTRNDLSIQSYFGRTYVRTVFFFFFRTGHNISLLHNKVDVKERSGTTNPRDRGPSDHRDCEFGN